MNTKVEIMPFQSLEDFYTYAETIDATKVSTISYKLKELLDTTEDEELKATITFEIEAFHFVLMDGRVKGYIKDVRKDGQTVDEYPSVSELTEKAMKHYSRRIEASKNNSLLIRYMQILVSTGNSAYVSDYIKNLVDIYLTELRSSLDKIGEERLNAHEWLSLLKNLLVLARKSKYRINDFTEIVKLLFFNDEQFPVSAK